MIKLLYFAGLREALGTSGEELVLPAGVTSVAALRDHVAARGEPWAALARTRNLRAAVNQNMAGPESELRDGDEVAFFPPVTGG
jgi:molybdopterin synthase sulfur carrier subunit